MTVSVTNRDRAVSYDRVSIALHWAVAAGIIALAALEIIRHEFPKGHFIREGLKSVHQPAGVVLMVLILARIAWRAYVGTPPKAQGSDLKSRAAATVHLALYVLMAAVPMIGLIAVAAAGKSIDFGLFKLSLPFMPRLGGYAKVLRVRCTRRWHLAC